MGSFAISLKCIECGNEHPPTILLHGCQKCGGFLDIQYDYDAIAKKVSIKEIERRKPSMMRKWIEFLPIEDESNIKLVTLGETVTPLIKCERLGKEVGVKELYVKNDSVFPTGSLKDRSVPLAVIKALELAVKTIAIVSSGNAAASVAAYGARAGLETIVFVSAEVPSSKLAQIMIYGAKAVVLKAEYSDIMKLFVAARKKFGWYDCNAEFNPFRFEGNKTYAYEICEQFGWKVPDRIVSPMGSCTGITGAWKGFKELLGMGWIDYLPRLAGIQVEACSPVVKAFKGGKSTVEPIVPGHTIATAIKVSDPPYGKRALQALYESKGTAEATNENEILEAVKLLAREGLFLEPAGAISVAGAKKLVKEGKIDRDERVVCVATGHGLKMPEIATDTLKKPTAIAPTLEEIEKVLRT